MTTQQKQSKENGVYGKRWVANGKQVNNVFNELVIQLLTCVWLFKTSWTAAAGLLWPLLSLGVCSKWRSLSLWCYLSLSSSAAPLNLVNPSVQFSSVTQSCPTLCDLKDCSMPGLPVHQQLLESTQTHAHWVGNSIQPSHPLYSPSPAFNLSQHQGLFKWVRSSYQVAKVLEFQLQHQSFQWIFRTDFP